MVDVEALAGRAQRVAARSRVRMACRIAVVIVPLACLSLANGGQVGACACLGAALFAVAAYHRWRDRAGVDAVRTGLLLGAVPLVAALGLNACGMQCAPGWAITEAEVACFAAGAIAGIAASLLVARTPRDRRRRWVSTILVASLTAALGCVGLGAAGVLSTLVALVASASVVWIPVALRAS
ncbi:MAG TPA: hypothetical protein VM513_18815 [Kofleriaceae bacterium]|jgi:hypothetical protein|nr:hypothetical protein [Kofleriaceae bacterium]